MCREKAKRGVLRTKIKPLWKKKSHCSLGNDSVGSNDRDATRGISIRAKKAHLKPHHLLYMLRRFWQTWNAARCCRCCICCLSPTCRSRALCRLVPHRTPSSGWKTPTQKNSRVRDWTLTCWGNIINMFKGTFTLFVIKMKVGWIKT